VAALALALVYCGQPEEAAACAERAVKLSRNDPVAGHYSWFCLANAELMRGRAEAAEMAIRRALALNPGFAWSHVLLANLLGLRGDTAGAQSVIADAAQLLGGVDKLIDIYRTLHLTRFERPEHAAKMAAGLTAAGFRGLVSRRPKREKSGGRRSVNSRR
jgi:tetratricopeptide (TPR) repeat protein